MPPRIGELLVQEGLVTLGDVQEALVLVRRQPIRLASALVSMGRLHADHASRALAAQHGVPAALDKHLRGRDVALAALLPAEEARALVALPIAVHRTEGALVVCVRDPVPATGAALERLLDRRVVLAVAVEHALRACLDEAYPPASPAPEPAPEEFDVDLDSGPVAADGLDLASMQLVDLDDRGVAKDHRHSNPAIRLPAEPVAWHAPVVAAVAPPRALALAPALVAVHAAADGGDVVDAALAFLRHRFAAGIVFVVKDDLALGQAGFGSEALSEAIAALAIPLAQPSVLRVAHERRAAFVGEPAVTSVVQERFFKLFAAPPRRVVVVPVVVKDRVVNLLYAHDPHGASLEDAAIELGTIADAASDAFVRIILESKA